MKILLKNKDIIVQKADKGNTVVILNRKDYVCEMKNILNDSSKFHKVYIDHDKVLNHLIHMESRVTDVLKNLRDKNEISIEQYKDLSPSGSRPGIMYGLAKVHKIVRDGLPSFRPILSAIGTPTYKLAKFLVPILEPLTTNEYTIKDSFTFAEELQSFDLKLVMASFDIESLFTNIPLQETIDLCVENFLRLPMFFFVIMKKFDFKIVLLNLNLLSIESTLMIHSYFFARNITSKNSEII